MQRLIQTNIYTVRTLKGTHITFGNVKRQHIVSRLIEPIPFFLWNTAYCFPLQCRNFPFLIDSHLTDSYCPMAVIPYFF